MFKMNNKELVIDRLGIELDMTRNRKVLFLLLFYLSGAVSIMLARFLISIPIAGDILIGFLMISSFLMTYWFDVGYTRDGLLGFVVPVSIRLVIASYITVNLCAMFLIVGFIFM